MGALARYAEDGTPSWIDLLGPLGVELDPGSVFRGVDPFSVYTWALYYSCATFTTIGYGDITIQNDREAAINVVIMLCCAACAASSRNLICSIREYWLSVRF